MSEAMAIQGDEYVGTTDNSSSEVEECNIGDNDGKFKDSSNDQLLNLYKPARIPMMGNNFQKGSQSAELIDLSSDDENVKNNDEDDENAANDGKNNGIQNHSHLKDLPTLPPRKIKTDKMEKLTIPARKRKIVTQIDNIKFMPSKQTKLPSVQESKVTFADFGGNTKALEEVCKLILHIQHPEFYRRIGLTSPRGFLLHGPPGCGKTLLATAIAGELDVHLLKVSAPELVGGVSGQSEERIRELFDSAVECAPCVLFIDEVDAITPNRQHAQREMERRIVAQLLTCLDELNNVPNGDQVLVIGATNRPDSLDPALRRAGRFDREVCLGIPDQKSREQILRVLCKNLKLSSTFSYEEVAENTPGFVGADLLSLTREAAMAAVNRVFEAIHRRKEEKASKRKKMKLDTKLDGSQGSNNETLMSGVNQIETSQSSVSEALASDCNGKEKEDEAAGDKVCESEGQKENVDSAGKVNCGGEGGKEKDIPSEKDESDMDVTETISEEDANTRDIEICKDESVKTVYSEDESEDEFLPESYESEPPSLETLLSWLRCTPPLTLKQLESIYLTQDDFKRALRCVQPSAKREGFATVPDVTWDDVGSLANIREELKMSILGPVKMRKQFEQLGLTTPSGILICGPPGCGKTLLAKAVANEAGINFISVKGPELLNMYVGESERAVRQCFQRARNSAPCVIFFDELDSLCPKRTSGPEGGPSMRVVNQMLTEMDGVEGRKEVFIMAATNRPDIVDPAVLRPGRLDKILYVGLPEEEDRVDILRALTKNGTRPKLASDVDLADIARREECNGYSGADLAAVVREAGVQAVKDLIAKSELDTEAPVLVSKKHFERALISVRPSVSVEDRKHYESLKRKYCSTT
ncbi:UNVERIFIED_CONTAM: hypothetical protein PYX00_001524 [Menopon gallinae]